MGIHLTWFALVLTISAIEPGNHENALPCLQQRHLHVLQCFRDPCPQKACCAVLHYLHVLTAPMKLPTLCRYVQRAQHGAADHMGQLQDPNVMHSVVLYVVLYHCYTRIRRCRPQKLLLGARPAVQERGTRSGEVSQTTACTAPERDGSSENLMVLRSGRANIEAICKPFLPICWSFRTNLGTSVTLWPCGDQGTATTQAPRPAPTLHGLSMRPEKHTEATDSHRPSAAQSLADKTLRLGGVVEFLTH